MWIDVSFRFFFHSFRVLKSRFSILRLHATYAALAHSLALIYVGFHKTATKEEAHGQ